MDTIRTVDIVWTAPATLQQRQSWSRLGLPPRDDLTIGEVARVVNEYYAWKRRQEESNDDET